MFFGIEKKIVVIPAAMFLALFLVAYVNATDDDTKRPLLPVIEKFQLTVGKSSIIHSPVAVKRVSVGNPEIADFVLLSPRDIFATGKSAGTTNLTLWSNSHVSAIYDLNVTYDVSSLKQELYHILPDEKDLQVIATNNSITLAGRISSSQNLSKALALTTAFASEGRVNNLVQVGGVHQVMLEVRIAEIARSTTKRLGINFNYMKDGEFGLSMLGGLSQLTKENGQDIIKFSPTVNALFQFNSNKTTWMGIVDALKNDGLAKILAEPTLIALSGQSAKFLAGGEFPIPIPNGDNVTIEYKEFGVGLAFTPTVLAADRILMEVAPEVSELDFSTAIQISGFVVPGLTTRKTTTTIELKDGQSFAIAGLLRENILEDVQKFPLLGDIPILGMLFRSESFIKNETELIIIVTPKLVKPLDVAKQSLPTDFYIEPSDPEFYLKGQLQGYKAEESMKPQFIMDGDFGHCLPDFDAIAKKK